MMSKPIAPGLTTHERASVATTPPTGMGYEAAVADAVAGQLGFSADQVRWVVVPFNNIFRPGPKDFDFDD